MVISEQIKALNHWQEDGKYIKRTVTLISFEMVMDVMNQIAVHCTEMNHHPEWFNVYNKLEIKLSTHDADGITSKDINLAQKIDNIIDSL